MDVFLENLMFGYVTAFIDCFSVVLVIMIMWLTLTRKKEASRTAAVWAAYVALYFVIDGLGYTLSFTLGGNMTVLGDLVAMGTMAFLLLLPAKKLYSEHFTSSAFILELAVLISLIATYVTGALATGVLAWLGIEFSALWMICFGIVKIPILMAFYLFYKLAVLKSAKEAIRVLDGKMGRYLPVAFMSIAFFYAFGAVTGYTPDMTLQFSLLYFLVCVTFAVMFWLIFSGVTWTSRALKTETELNVASKIQHDMLPCIFPAFPGRAEFDVYASMQPAKEVGGDFYDFFLIDDDTLAVVMADVSGKGVPAALFMVIAKTLLKNNAQYGKTPKDVFETVNNLLCENNEAGMFVTAFMGYLDIPTGKFTFVNAGHNPPLLRSGEQFDWLKAKPGFVLAGMEDMFYKQHEITLNVGDELFLYTDGVTEAVNREDELFSDPKLLKVANQNLDLPLKEFTVSIKREIDTFADGAEQADDITMLALRYKGKQPSK